MNEILPVGGFDLIEEDLIILKKILSNITMMKVAT